MMRSKVDRPAFKLVSLTMAYKKEWREAEDSMLFMANDVTAFWEGMRWLSGMH